MTSSSAVGSAMRHGGRLATAAGRLQRCQGASRAVYAAAAAAAPSQAAAPSGAQTVLTITRPDDWHLHVRDGAMMAAVLPHTAATFARAIIMPNLQPPVTEVHQVLPAPGSMSIAGMSRPRLVPRLSVPLPLCFS